MRRKTSMVIYMMMAVWLMGFSHAISFDEECPMIYWPRFMAYYGDRFMSHHPLAWNDLRPVREKFVSFGDTVVGYVWKYSEIVPRRKVKDGRPACLVVWGEACDTTMEWKAVLTHDSLEFAEKIGRYEALVSKDYEDSAEAVLCPIDVPTRSVYRLRSGVAYSEEWKRKFGVDPWHAHRLMRNISHKAGRFYLTIEMNRFLEEGGYAVIFAWDPDELRSGRAEAYADKFIAGIVNIEEEWGKWDKRRSQRYPRYKMTVIRGKLRKGSSRVQYCPPILPEQRGPRSGQ